MKIKTPAIAAITLGALTLVGILGIRNVSAQTNNTPVVDKLVERFGLNQDEVTGVFDEVQQEVQQERQTQRRAQMEAKIDEAVSDGVITADQKQALLDKDAEMQEKYQQLREEWQQWQEQSGIDFEALAPYHFGGCGGGRGFGRGHPFGGLV